ncbi:MAG: formate dehydrogenase accessory sulfurtransferase FdhD [Desulfobacterales bacterium]|nr:formate dehydrogenase accessory sulfurtransferase FdhD [Desulfobacterales bacterium]
MNAHNNMYKTFRSIFYSGEKFSTKKTDLILESPLEIIVNGQRHILIMFTPQLIKELVLGFLFTEGIINSKADIEKFSVATVQKEGEERVIEASVTITPEKSSARMIESQRVSYSSCGICGMEGYYDLKNRIARVKSRQRFSMDILEELMSGMEKFQPLYRKTGGAHAAMLFDRKGGPLFYCEDMGRHNALDKVIGYTLLAGISCDDKIILSSGRASLEMIFKTAKAGAPVFVAKSRPTSRAVEAAKFFNITLIDLAKGTNRIHSHVRRIKGF